MKYEDHVKELMEDPEFRAAQEEIEPWVEIARAIIRERINRGLTWKQAAKLAGVSKKAYKNVVAFEPEAQIGDIQKMLKALGLKLKVVIE